MILVVGSGVAGLSCALAAARAGAATALVVPGRLQAGGASGAGGPAGSAVDGAVGGSTALAQGGIAAAIGFGDTPEAHLADTVAAGAGLVDVEAAAALTRDGAEAVRELLRQGFAADRAASGALRLGLEGAHGYARIVHAGGDRTGAVLHRHLVALVLAEAAAGRIELLEERVAVDLRSEAGAVRGAVLESTVDGALEFRRADAVVLATGGYAALYERSTNPASSRGEGVVLAARAGAVLADLEFVQFHPTVLHGSGLLVSEAVRGAGAVLRDGSGERFMVGRHPLAELAPRDVVSHEMQRVMRERGEPRLWLDATGIEREGGPGTLERRFPGITAAVAASGVDWSREPVPVSPAAHYTMGGIASDLRGRSSVPGLFVAGEAAATGVHGANRLASNSLLEGLVFGGRAGVAAADFARSRSNWRLEGAGMGALVAEARPEAIAVAVEVEQGGGSGSAARSEAASSSAAAARSAASLRAMIELAAQARCESRGAHQRVDAPDTDPAQARRRGFVFVIADPPPAALAASATPADPALGFAPDRMQQRSLAQC
ncbi:L-aspartate oxidase [Leucobacter chironomi]|uniref:L-aspartate oxidase n=1 Tax=Leucobacter chironomi TaxID=491918 RepID=UPI00040AC14E|nr:FAD-dependent oxidoreductase [Leucobacter chironomi]